MNTTNLQKDFPELEGTIIDYTNCFSGEKSRAVVAGCNYDVGITLVDEKDRAKQVVCLNGQLKDDEFTDLLGWDFMFYAGVTQILSGYYNNSGVRKLYGSGECGGGSMSTCAFSM